MTTAENWSEHPLLAEIGPTMTLPRRATPPRNVEPFRPQEWGRFSGKGEEVTTSAWDAFDYLAVMGGLVSAAGLFLALLPQTRSWGVLVPVGLALMALAAYTARRKDGAGA